MGSFPEPVAASLLSARLTKEAALKTWAAASAYGALLPFSEGTDAQVLAERDRETCQASAGLERRISSALRKTSCSVFDKLGPRAQQLIKIAFDPTSSVIALVRQKILRRPESRFHTTIR